MTATAYRADPQILSLGGEFFDAVVPANFPRVVPRFRNRIWDRRVGLGALSDDDFARHFGRFEPLPQNLGEPLALRYHGHQFGTYNRALGDGRGFLFAQLRDDEGRLLDLGTKGSGTTPWSRGGDGRLTLKGGFREVLATEMLEARGVTTSKTFALFETGEMLQRGDEPSPTRSSVLTRLSHSHIRIGTFQRLAHLAKKDEIAVLVEYVRRLYFPFIEPKDQATTARLVLRETARRLADLTASFMVSGFVHGVLNTDNLSVTGESFDYGPYRFTESWDPGFVAAYFDEGGRYAFGRQQAAILFGLQRFAECLAAIGDMKALAGELIDFDARVMQQTHARLLHRLALTPENPLADADLGGHVICFLQGSKVPLEGFFADLEGGTVLRAEKGPRRSFYAGAKWDALRPLLSRSQPAAHARRDGEIAFETLLIDEIESLWTAVATRDDWSGFEAKIAAIRAAAQPGMRPLLPLLLAFRRCTQGAFASPSP